MIPPTADTLIVGGGLIGCALAAELAARGQRVTVVDRGEPGGEASGAAAGMLIPQAEGHAPGPFFELALESRGLYSDWSRLLFEETGIDTGYRRTGLLRCGFGESEEEPLLSAYRWQVERGLRVEGRTDSSLSSELDGRLSGAVRSAVFFPDEAMVDPRLLTRAAWLSALRRGVTFATGCVVRSFVVERGVCLGAETDAGTLSAGATVDAAGAWAAFEGRMPVAVPVHPVRGQIVELRVEGRPLATIACSDEVYLVPRPDGTVLAGSTMELVGFRKEVTAEAVGRLIAAAIRLVPPLASARFVTAWAGLRPGTPDGLPILGETPVRGLYLAAGHFRNGILLAPATARRLADRIAEGPGSGALAAFSVERFAGAFVPA